MSKSVTLIHSHDAAWTETLSQWYPLLGAPHNSALLPVHFTQVVLPKIGGKLALIRENGEADAMVFLFPRNASAAPSAMGGQRLSTSQLYTARYHKVISQEETGTTEPLPALLSNPQELLELINISLNQDSVNAEEQEAEHQSLVNAQRAILYQPGVRNTYRATAQAIGEFDNLPLTLGNPSQDEAETTRQLHQLIWQGADSSLYPVDLHSREFGLATDLVVRVGEEVVGFLMGYYKLGRSALPSDWRQRIGGDWRIESQVMGVLPGYRGHHLGYLLKRAQGELALRNGVQLINWTADPLQFPNAVLNFHRLGAVAFDFSKDLYPFRNELNRVSASRFGLTWLAGTKRVRERPLEPTTPQFVDVVAEQLPRLNKGPTRISQPECAPRVAIEIPADWTAIQKNDQELALTWRNELDALFSEYIGLGAGQYTVTDVGKDGDRCYLIAEQSTDQLWSRLAQ